MRAAGPTLLSRAALAMETSHHPQRRRAILMLVLATLYWGLSFPVIKTIAALNHLLVPEAGTWFLAAATLAPRFTIAAVIVLAFVWRKGLPSRAEMTQGFVIGAFAGGGTLFQTDGLQFTEASTSAFLTQMSAILIPTLLAIRHWRNPGPKTWFACVLVLAGVAILGHVSWTRLKLGRGEWETLLASCFFVGQILSVENRNYASNRVGMVTLTMFSVQGAMFIALAALTAPHVRALAVPWTSPTWLVLTIVLAVVCTVAAFSLMNVWQPKITATEAGLIYCIEPLFASLFALILPRLLADFAGIDYANERVTWTLFVGGGLVTLANVWALKAQTAR
jgi:drug/metabolite transporter (DMT)-like permease